MAVSIPRWMVERKYENERYEILQIIEVYAVGETKEVVKEENKHLSYSRHLIMTD